jgi:hypothetical protein
VSICVCMSVCVCVCVREHTDPSISLWFSNDAEDERYACTSLCADVSLFVCVCVYVCVNTRTPQSACGSLTTRKMRGKNMYVHVFVCVFTHACMSLYVCLCMSVCTCVSQLHTDPSIALLFSNDAEDEK